MGKGGIDIDVHAQAAAGQFEGVELLRKPGAQRAIGHAFNANLHEKAHLPTAFKFFAAPI